MASAELKQSLRSATSWWSLTCRLVEAWLARPDLADAPWHGPDDVFDAYGALVLEIEDGLALIDPTGPTPAQVELICDVLDPDDVWRHAAAIDAIDRKCHPAFCNDWVLEHDAPFALQAGALYPVPSWEGPTGWEYSRSPTNFAHRPREFPRVRVHDPAAGFSEPVEIVFDPTAEVELTAALTQLGTLATIHPNEAWSELAMSESATAFPVSPIPTGQLDVLIAGVAVALHEGAQLVVLPELCVTDEITDTLHAWLGANEVFAVVVLGSFHAEVDGHPANVSRTYVGPTEFRHRKIVPFTNEAPGSQPSREGIKPGPRQIRVLVGAGYRFSVAICKDFLDADIRHALMRAGVNVLAVPAMSAAMGSYPAEVDGHVLATQGVVTVANNPGRRGDGQQILPAFVFGQPNRHATHVAGPPADAGPAPYVAVFRLGDDEGHCFPLREMVD